MKKISICLQKNEVSKATSKILYFAPGSFNKCLINTFLFILVLDAIRINTDKSGMDIFHCWVCQLHFAVECIPMRGSRVGGSWLGVQTTPRKIQS